MSEAPAGLYIHVPFCARICPYCDFAVRTGNADRRRRYVEHLLQEIELYAGYPLEFDTIYFGGGTPSALEPEDLPPDLIYGKEGLRFDQFVASLLAHLRSAPEEPAPEENTEQ